MDSHPEVEIQEEYERMKYAVAYFISDGTFEVGKLEWSFEEFSKFKNDVLITVEMSYDGVKEKCVVLHISTNEDGLDHICEYLAKLKSEKKWSIEKIWRRHVVPPLPNTKRQHLKAITAMTTESEAEEKQNIEVMRPRPFQTMTLPEIGGQKYISTRRKIRRLHAQSSSDCDDGIPAESTATSIDDSESYCDQFSVDGDAVMVESTRASACSSKKPSSILSSNASDDVTQDKSTSVCEEIRPISLLPRGGGEVFTPECELVVETRPKAVSSSGGAKTILKNLCILSEKIDRGFKEIHKRLDRIGGTNHATEPLMAPLKLEDLSQYEQFLENVKDGTYRENLIQSLCFHGGSNEEQMGKRALDFLLGPIFQRSFNYYGKRGKLSFSEVLGPIVKDAVHRVFPSCNYSLVDKKLQRYLILASDRCGGRSARAAKTVENSQSASR